MIELPEAITIANQISNELQEKTIQSSIRMQDPHRFAFIGKHTHQEFAKIVLNKKIGKARANGNIILVNLDPGYVLSLGCGGERILYHTSKKTIPKKHQLLLTFNDGSYLSVTVSGWGEVRLLEETEVSSHPHIKHNLISPDNETFTFEYFDDLFKSVPTNRKVSAKYFLITEPCVWGLGNGSVQDILFHAKIHPKQQVIGLSEKQKESFYHSIKNTISEMIKLGGRDSDRDLYGNFGGYKRILHSKMVGKPCPECSTSIEKQQYLGGTIYFCPNCQILSE
ncbi:MAG: DNA-formamidopyrimidine glycosylase family protein [Promethearchaeota archaeon]|jgi:formamidopyrimidine-DNA glycosylase